MSMPDQETLQRQLGEALTQLREGRSLTRSEVAHRMGEKPAFVDRIARWERGEDPLPAHELWRYLIAIGASFAELGRELSPGAGGNPRLREIVRELDSIGALAKLRSSASPPERRQP